MLEKLKASYDEAIPEKINGLAVLIGNIQQNPSIKNLQELKESVHKIAGTAGSFGYEEVTRLCKEMQNEVIEQMKLAPSFDSKWISSLSDFLSKIKEHFLQIKKPSEKGRQTRENKQIPLVFVVDPDKKFLLSLEQIVDSFQFELKTSSDPGLAIDILGRAEIVPDAIFCSLDFPGSYYNGYAILNALPPHLKNQVTIKGLIINQDNLDIRIDAVQRGINLVFKRPLLAQSFLHMAEEAVLLEKMRKYKVLILDDDVDFCNFAIVVLSSVGIEVKGIQFSEELFSELQLFKPNLLLLDLVLPKYDGMNLLKTLRQDATYKNLPIIIVTGSDETTTAIEAYSAKADGVLFKPISVDLLQKRVLNFLDRKEQYLLDEMQETPSIEICHKNLLKKIHSLMQHDVEGCFLVLFEMTPHLESVREKTARRDAEIPFFTELTINEPEIRVEYFAYDENISALVFERTTLDQTKSKTLDYFSSWIESNNSPKQKIRGVLLQILEKVGENPEQLVIHGESQLKLVEIPQNEPLSLALYESNIQAVRKKEIVIVDPDEELTNILKISFEERDFHVRIFRLGKEALDYLLNPNMTIFPSLVITERKLVDMDGLLILKQLKKNLKDPPPVFILTVFSSDKDISDGLSAGATEYIVKPFNTALLIQKALKAIHENG